MKKCAWIKSKDGKCPFGLPITEGCQFAGDSVSHMCPLKTIPKDKQEVVEKANKRVYLYYKTNTRCMYAANIIESLNAVNCDFGDTEAGMSMPSFSGSPLYAQTFAGIGLDGLYAFPLGFYADNNESRNLFQGLFSLVGNKIYELLKSGSIVSEEIIEKLSLNELLTNEEQLELFRAVENCREKYEDNSTDTGKLNEFINKWYPRKRL
jgi:hypothetical protein